MHLIGSHLLKAPVHEVWDKLHNPDILAKVTPGIKTQKTPGENIYQALSEFKIGPVNTSFHGEFDVADQHLPERFVMLIEQNNKIDNAQGTLHIEVGGEYPTEVFSASDAQIFVYWQKTGKG